MNSRAESPRSHRPSSLEFHFKPVGRRGQRKGGLFRLCPPALLSGGDGVQV